MFAEFDYEGQKFQVFLQTSCNVAYKGPSGAVQTLSVAIIRYGVGPNQCVTGLSLFNPQDNNFGYRTGLVKAYRRALKQLAVHWGLNHYEDGFTWKSKLPRPLRSRLWEAFKQIEKEFHIQ